MKNVSTELINTIRNEQTVTSAYRVVAEWNMNRYVPITSVTVNDDNTYLDAFPIKSVVSPERPSKSGIVRMATDNGIIAEPEDNLPARYYPVATDDPYKYWISKPSSGVIVAGGGFRFATNPEITAIYAKGFKTNKLQILVENNFNQVISASLQVKTEIGSDTWSTVSNNVTFNAEGKGVLYFQGSSWSTGEGSYLNNTITIYGLRLTINAVAKREQPVGIIEISPRLVSDISQYIIDMSVDDELSDVSFTSPIGAASSNQASLTLSNTDGTFNNDNTSSPYYELLDKNVLIYGEVGIKVGGSFEYVRMFTMLSQNWSGQTTEEVRVNLEDDSSRMKLSIPPKMLLEDINIGKAISILCDVMGYTNYLYSLSVLDGSQTIDFFIVDGEKTLWEIISELSVGTQTVVYFDCFNVMQIKSRNTFLNQSRDAVWRLEYERNGLALPDIISYEEEYLMEANSVDVVYTPTKLSEFNNGQPKMEVSWEPEDTMVLRAAPLSLTLEDNGRTVTIPPEKAATWPFEGMLHIDAEVIRFKGKSYEYWLDSAYSVTVKVNSQEEQKRYDAMTPDRLRYRNKYIGVLHVTTRGVNNTPISRHSRTTEENWQGYITEDGVTNPWTWNGGYSVNNSIMTLTTNYTFREQNNYCVRSPSFANPAPGNKVHYGTRLKFREGYSPNNLGEAGIFIASNPTNFVGYWVSLRLTEAVEATNRFRNEVAIWGRMGDYWTTTYDHQPLEIRRGVWYDVDVTFEIAPNHDHIIVVFINGVAVASTKLTGGNRIITGGGQHGIQVGNFSSVDFEYYYSAQGDASYAPDTSTLHDEIRGGFANGVIQSNWYKTAFYDDLGGLSGTKDLGRNVFFDDYGAIVHEIREFDVTFEKPVVHSKPYVTNEKVAIPAYFGNPFGAHFVMINAGREDAIVKGEDSQTYGSDNTVTQSAFIYGRQIYQEDAETITIVSQENINKRGVQKTQFASQYLQNKEVGDELARWVVKQWGSTVKTANVTIFGNPMLEVGDIVTVTYVPKGIYDKKFYINKIGHSYSAGLETNLTLRSVANDVVVSMNSFNTGSAGQTLPGTVYVT